MGISTVKVDPDDTKSSTNQNLVDNASNQKERHREYMSYAKDGGSHFSILKFKDTIHDWYNVPLGAVTARKKDEAPKKGQNVLTPVKPSWLTTPKGHKDKDKAEPLREGWLYVFLDGYLWRELQVNDHSKLMDVNLTHQKGFNTRISSGEKDDRILVPYKVDGNEPVIQMAFSEVQWSWAYINRMGGMDPDDFRTNKFHQPHMPEDIGVSKSDAAQWRSKRMQTIKLDGREAGFPVTPNDGEFAGVENVSHITATHTSLTKHKKTNIAIAYLIDSVGVAKRLAAEHQVAVAVLETEFEALQGISYGVKNGIGVRNTDEHQAALYHTAAFIAGYFYQSVDDASPNQTAEQKKSTAKRQDMQDKYIHQNDLENFLNKSEFNNLTQIVIDIRKELVEFLEDTTSHANFTDSVADAFAGSGSLTGQGHEIVAEVITFLNHHPAGNFKEIEVDVKKLRQQSMQDTGPEFLLTLLDGSQTKPVHKLNTYLFPKSGGVKDDPTSINKDKVPPGMPEFDIAKYRGCLTPDAKPPKLEQGAGEKNNEKFNWQAVTGAAFKMIASRFADSQFKAFTDIAEGTKARSAAYAKMLKPKGNVLTPLARFANVVLDGMVKKVDVTLKELATGNYSAKGVTPFHPQQHAARLITERTTLKNATANNVLTTQLSGLPNNKTVTANWPNTFYLEGELIALQHAARTSGNKASIATFPAFGYIMQNGIAVPNDKPNVKPAVTNASGKATPDPVHAKLKLELVELDKNIEYLKTVESTKRPGSKLMVSGTIIAVGVLELWSLGEAVKKYSKQGSLESVFELTGAFSNIVGTLADFREHMMKVRGINTGVSGKEMARVIRQIQLGKATKFDKVYLKRSLGTIAGRTVMVIGNIVGMGLSVRDYYKAMYRNDPAAMLAHGMLFTSGAAGLTALFLGGAFLGPLAIILLIAALGILYFFSDSDLVTWLKNGAFGSVDVTISQGYGMDSDTWQCNKKRYGGGKPGGIFKNDYFIWKKHPEYVYYELMDTLYKPQIKWEKTHWKEHKLSLEVRLPNYQLGISELDAELISGNFSMVTGSKPQKINLFSKGKALVTNNKDTTHVDIANLWSTAKVSLLDEGKGYRINFSQESFRLMTQRGVWLKFRCKVHPFGKGAKLLPESDIVYSLPAPLVPKTAAERKKDDSDYWAEGEISLGTRNL